jgi:hypothetical protein
VVSVKLRYSITSSFIGQRAVASGAESMLSIANTAGSWTLAIHVRVGFSRP